MLLVSLSTLFSLSTSWCEIFHTTKKHEARERQTATTTKPYIGLRLYPLLKETIVVAKMEPTDGNGHPQKLLDNLRNDSVKDHQQVDQQQLHTNTNNPDPRTNDPEYLLAVREEESDLLDAVRTFFDHIYHGQTLDSLSSYQQLKVKMDAIRDRCLGRFATPSNTKDLPSSDSPNTSRAATPFLLDTAHQDISEDGTPTVPNKNNNNNNNNPSLSKHDHAFPSAGTLPTNPPKRSRTDTIIPSEGKATKRSRTDTINPPTGKATKRNRQAEGQKYRPRSKQESRPAREYRQQLEKHEKSQLLDTLARNGMDQDTLNEISRLPYCDVVDACIEQLLERKEAEKERKKKTKQKKKDPLLDAKVRKHFANHGWFTGVVKSYDAREKLYHVVYEDDDHTAEVVDLAEAQQLVQNYQQEFASPPVVPTQEQSKEAASSLATNSEDTESKERTESADEDTESEERTESDEETESKETFKATEKDVLIGNRGNRKSYDSFHPGNLYLMSLIEEKSERYLGARNHLPKYAITRGIIQRIYERGGFLKAIPGWELFKTVRKSERGGEWRHFSFRRMDLLIMLSLLISA